MPEPSVEYRLGEMSAGIHAVMRELQSMRDDIIKRFDQHDQRDDERFASHAARLAIIEKGIATEQGRDAGSAQGGERLRRFIEVATSGLGGALGGWLLSHFGR
jgi:hypothetical protein